MQLNHATVFLQITGKQIKRAFNKAITKGSSFIPLSFDAISSHFLWKVFSS